MTKWATFLLASVLSLGGAATARADDAQAGMNREVTALLDALRTSACNFNRNGTWYDGAEAAKHLERKYRYLRDKLASTEQFIEQGGSASSMSGEPYQVRCGEAAAVASGEWLLEKLYELRASGRFDDQ